MPEPAGPADGMSRPRLAGISAEIAAAEAIQCSRIQHMIALAFLAPDLVDRITQGTHPVGLTSDWTMRNAIPAERDAQAKLFEKL